MTKVSELILEDLKVQLESCNVLFKEHDLIFQEKLQGLETFFECLKKTKIKFRQESKNDVDSVASLESNATSIDTDTKSDTKRGRQKKIKNTINPVEFTKTDEVEDKALNNSNSSSRSQRAAAQAADQKRIQGEILLKATKLRRPTDFNEQSKGSNVSSPPNKSRKTHRKQSAGSSPPQDLENNEPDENMTSNTEDTQRHSARLSRQVVVDLQLLTPLTIQSHLKKSSSLDRITSKRKSSDLFGGVNSQSDSDITESKTQVENIKNEPDVVSHENKKLNKKPRLNKSLSKSTNDVEIVELPSETFVTTINDSPASEESFKGFSPGETVALKNVPVLRGNTFVKETHSDGELIDLRSNKLKQTNLKKSMSTFENHNNIERETKEVVGKPTRQKLLRKQNEKSEHKAVELDNKSALVEDCKATKQPSGAEISHVVLSSDSGNDEINNSDKNMRARTKVIKKHDKEQDSDAECRSRTKTIRKVPMLKDENKQEIVVSPAPAKGELVKKRVEDFEKLKNKVVQVEEEPTGRVTRGRNKVIPTSTSLGQRTIKINKVIGSAVRPSPQVDNSSALVHKQALEEIEMKKREEERIKRQAKEETAKKKKEKTLKATAEEARRKREEKLQKVAAAREAADKEKQLLALKAEKEREEKMQQIAAEKEKQKEEQLKKKQLAQQKVLEHEERRRLEEEARQAKLREQEEEHKRILAMKEREMDLQKQQKPAELRLAETEKAKLHNHGNKLGKIAAVNNAHAKLKQVSTPATQVSSYEITPAREDRPVIESKTEDDYGIDDARSEDSSDDESQPKKKIPLWAQSSNRHALIKVNSMIPSQMWSLFMEANPNPDVNDIFDRHHVYKRTRTSSAVWKTPPLLY